MWINVESTSRDIGVEVNWDSSGGGDGSSFYCVLNDGKGD